MLPSFLRLALRALPHFFSHAATRRGNIFLLKFNKESASSLRIAIVVPKRFGGAVQRSKIKRWTRSALIALEQQDSTRFALPYSLVFIVQRLPQNYQEVKNDIAQLIDQLA